MCRRGQSIENSRCPRRLVEQPQLGPRVAALLAHLGRDEFVYQTGSINCEFVLASEPEVRRDRRYMLCPGNGGGAIGNACHGGSRRNSADYATMGKADNTQEDREAGMCLSAREKEI